MSWKIRPAKAEDYHAVARVQQQVAQLHHNWRPDVYCPAKQYDKTRYEELLVNPDTPIFVAEQDGQVQGYAMLRVITPQNPVMVQRSYAHVEDLCVDETCRKQGVGEALMRAVEDFARQRKLDAIELGVWECNKAARKFYERLGYTTQRRGLEIKIS
ncbi:MAG: GNAT family N-acetyltransferase [Oscillospiraceae bacterium]|nr:GNAT family N-acetyltransferase [Oscillospiraceae bacterium]